MSARSKARKRALDVLYEADIRGLDPVMVLRSAEQRRAAAAEPALNSYVAELVDGVVAHLAHIDEILASTSRGWSVERMAAVDRAALRIGTYELLWRDEVPDAVAISEAVALVEELSSDESVSFVNGILGRIVELKPRLALD